MISIEHAQEQSKLNAFILAARPKTLAAAFVPILVATAVAYSELKTNDIKVQWSLSLFALLSSIFIQIGTNFVNDAIDFNKGADNEKRIGPKRMTQSGLLSARQVLFGGFCCFLLASIFGIPLIVSGGFPILIVGMISIICGYIYTGGPYPLAYKGLGELFVILFFGIVAVLGVYYLQTNSIHLHAFIASLQIGFLATVLISINNFRDSIEDKKVHKMTLAAIFGKKFARLEIASLFSFAYLLNIYWYLNGYIFVALLPLISMPLAIYVTRGLIVNEPSPLFNKFLGMSAAVQMLFGIFMSIGFFIR
ncbi:1,4-dihydroxy-2-naphthoate polyprenyltransferase [Fluviispira vulneris]|uniref:1,4-dihydroxy-2-naphthoate polyprenyltransferase n=1 Tax=Fluviispira vulneris TaxID=2763012 RepID=UPI001645CD6E|nr:1,4-dihydroxy-2-naphthoate polyprenyltransferase [Fluviispira vulneris]